MFSFLHNGEKMEPQNDMEHTVQTVFCKSVTDGCLF